MTDKGSLQLSQHKDSFCHPKVKKLYEGRRTEMTVKDSPQLRQHEDSFCHPNNRRGM